MAASAFAKTLPQSLTSRTLFVKCTPPPASFTERRAILKALCTTGPNPDIEVFKQLDDNSSFIAVTSSQATASALVNDSPLTRFIQLQSSDATAKYAATAWGAAFRKTITEPINIQTRTQLEKERKQNGLPERGSIGLNAKTFTIHVFPANYDYNHQRAIEMNPLHGPWPDTDGRETFMSATLKRTVPSGALARALRDWETGHQLSGGPMPLEEEGAQSLIKKVQHGRSFILERRRRREYKNNVPDVMRSLAAVAQEQQPEGNASGSLATSEVMRTQAAEAEASTTRENIDIQGRWGPTDATIGNRPATRGDDITSSTTPKNLSEPFGTSHFSRRSKWTSTKTEKPASSDANKDRLSSSDFREIFHDSLGS
ncbi:hypothetical protein BX600DRAFT_509903 [Xylariales sp. PMI_506]|nr:hypothetical protein BX600DRAFT_509903 [Xylariales sp. PMI_506]